MLLDGGFLRYKLSKRQTPVDAAGISAFTASISALPCLRGMRLHRIYFYDSKPLETSENKPLGGGRIDFGVTAAAARNKSLQSPAMKFARREGAQLILVTLGHGIRDGLREHADVVIDHLPPLAPALTPPAPIG